MNQKVDRDEGETTQCIPTFGLNHVSRTSIGATASGRSRRSHHGRDGAVVLTISAFRLTGRGGDGTGGSDGYVASKHGVVGLMRTFATWLAPHGVRVNCVNPTGVATRMVLNPAVEALFGGGDDPAPGPKPVDDVTNLFDVPLVQVEDVTAAVAFLASDEARYITGVALPVDAEMLVR